MGKKTSWKYINLKKQSRKKFRCQKNDSSLPATEEEGLFETAAPRVRIFSHSDTIGVLLLAKTKVSLELSLTAEL